MSGPISWPPWRPSDLDDPFDVSLLTETDLDSDGARLADQLSAQSLMGGRRLVRLQLTGDRAAADRAAAEALKAHADGAYNPDAFLIVEAGGLGKDSALRKAAEKAEACVAIPCYEDEPGDVARLVREALSKDKVGLNSEALELFVSRLPGERGVARQEIERLILYLGPGPGWWPPPTIWTSSWVSSLKAPLPPPPRTPSAASWPPPTRVFAAPRRRAKPAPPPSARSASTWPSCARP